MMPEQEDQTGFYQSSISRENTVLFNEFHYLICVFDPGINCLYYMPIEVIA
jgi:hypothetical protein